MDEKQKKIEPGDISLTTLNQTLQDILEELQRVDQAEAFGAVVQSLGRLSKELQMKLGDVEKAAAKELPEPNISVSAPEVHVAAPDISGIEDLLNKQLPVIVKQMTDAIPEVPGTDLGSVEKLLDELGTIMAQVRDRKIPVPQMPTTLKVVNPDGSNVFSGGSVTVNSAPTYKDDPTAAGETPKYGKTNPVTHKQQVEVDITTNTVGLALESGGNLAEIAIDTDKLDVNLSTRLKPADTLTKVATVDTITNPVTTLEGTGLVPKVYDALTYTNTSATVDTYKYYQSGTGGTLIATLTIIWTDSTKTILTSVVRT